jgi:CBS domain-containing protein
MKKPVIELTIASTIRDVLDLMKEKRIGSVVIIDEDYMPVDIITEFDIINLIDENNVLPNLPLRSLNRKTNLYTVFETDSIDDAIKIFSEKKIHHLVVIDCSGLVIGILSTKDVIYAQKALNRAFPYFPLHELIR